MFGSCYLPMMMRGYGHMFKNVWFQGFRTDEQRLSSQGQTCSWALGDGSDHQISMSRGIQKKIDFGSGFQSYVLEFKTIVRYTICRDIVVAWKEVIGRQGTWEMNLGCFQAEGPENMVNLGSCLQQIECKRQILWQLRRSPHVSGDTVGDDRDTRLQKNCFWSSQKSQSRDSGRRNS